jgi:GT2 family glycosyltransferase
LIGILPTYRRTPLLTITLGRLAEQTRALDRLIVVDNEGSADTRSVVEAATLPGCRMEYLWPGQNTGFAGGVAAGMRRALADAADDDWMVLLDDDDPPRFVNALEVLSAFAAEMRARDPQTAAVGIGGGWFDWRRGRMRRVPDSRLVDAVAVDHVGGNQLPFFHAGTVRKMGVFCDELFFGFSELEYGLRLWKAGYALYGHGALWRTSRERTGRLNRQLRPSWRLAPLSWRDYYTLRNAIFILRRFGRRDTALRVTLLHGFAKPLANVPTSPRLAVAYLRVNSRAALDGWRGRMGRRVDPDGALRVEKAREEHATVEGAA